MELRYSSTLVIDRLVASMVYGLYSLSLLRLLRGPCRGCWRSNNPIREETTPRESFSRPQVKAPTENNSRLLITVATTFFLFSLFLFLILFSWRTWSSWRNRSSHVELLQEDDDRKAGDFLSCVSLPYFWQPPWRRGTSGTVRRLRLLLRDHIWGIVLFFIRRGKKKE